MRKQILPTSTWGNSLHDRIGVKPIWVCNPPTPLNLILWGIRKRSRNETSVFSLVILPIPPYSAATNQTMRTLVVVFVLALIAITFEVYSDAALTSTKVPHAAPDPATTAIVRGLKTRAGS